jgi:hypothetical protein
MKKIRRRPWREHLYQYFCNGLDNLSDSHAAFNPLSKEDQKSVFAVFFNLRSLCLSDCNDISVNSLFYQFPYQRAHRLSGRHSGLSLGQKSRDGSRLQLRCGFSNRTDSLFSLKVFLQIKKL